MSVRIDVGNVPHFSFTFLQLFCVPGMRVSRFTRYRVKSHPGNKFVAPIIRIRRTSQGTYLRNTWVHNRDSLFAPTVSTILHRLEVISIDLFTRMNKRQYTCPYCFYLSGRNFLNDVARSVPPCP